MIIEDHFDVPAPIDRVWPLLKDVPRVATAIPHAEITEVVDATTYKAAVAVKVGPVAVSYKATIYVEEFNDETHTARLRVEGQDVKGRGGVTALVTSQAQEHEGGTRVTLHTDAKISGIIATVGGRMIEGVAKKTISTFAANLAKMV